MDIPEDLKYAKSHEWVSAAEDGVVTVGITAFAQDQLGDVVFVELPEAGTRVTAGDAVAVVESVKTASDIYAPMSGEVAEVNDVLEGTPEKVNQDPYGSGWLFRLTVEDEGEREDLLDADGYRTVTEEDG